MSFDHSMLSAVFACATCMGDPGTKSSLAATGAIGLMLGVLGLVFGGMMAVAVGFARRARRPHLPSGSPTADET
jgi:hypothetical protein